MGSHAITIDIKNMTTTRDTLSTRLLSAINRLKISQSELARMIGVKPQVIQYLCTSNANKSKFAFEIATALSINPNWLIAGKGTMFDLSETYPASLTQPKVPLLTWENISNWVSKSEDQPQKIEYIFVTHEPTSSSYALRVVDSSMIPRFEIDTILIIDPSLKPNPSDFVIAQTSHQQLPIIRQLILKEERYYLIPMNTAIYKEVELKTDDKILGIVKQAYFEFAR